MEPAGLTQGGAIQPFSASSGRDQTGGVDVEYFDVPVRFVHRPRGISLRHTAGRPDLQGAERPASACGKARLRGFGEIGRIEIVAVQRSDRIGMQHDIAARCVSTTTFTCHMPTSRASGDCGLTRTMKEPSDSTVPTAPAVRRHAHSAPDIGVNPSVTQRGRRRSRRKRPDFDLMWIKGRIDG